MPASFGCTAGDRGTSFGAGCAALSKAKPSNFSTPEACSTTSSRTTRRKVCSAWRSRRPKEWVTLGGSGAPRSVATVLECITEATDGVTVVDHGRSERLIEASGARSRSSRDVRGGCRQPSLNWALRTRRVRAERAEGGITRPANASETSQGSPAKCRWEGLAGPRPSTGAAGACHGPYVTVADRHEDCLAGLAPTAS